MGFKFNLSQTPKLDPESAAKKFCTEVHRKFWELECATYDPNSLREARKQFHSLRDNYNQARGNESGNRLLYRADCVAQKLSEIMNLNPEDWNNYRRGQQFRRLYECIFMFSRESHRSQHSPEPLSNVVPFRPS